MLKLVLAQAAPLNQEYNDGQKSIHIRFELDRNEAIVPILAF